MKLDARGYPLFEESDTSPDGTFSGLLNLALAAIATASASGAGTEMAKTFVVELYARATDTSDDQAWQRAIDAAVAQNVPARILGTRTQYTIADPIICNNARVLLLEGAGGFGAATTFLPKAGSRFGAEGTRAIVFRVNSAATRPIDSLTFKNLTFDGKLAAEPAGMARDTREYGAEWINTAVRIDAKRGSGPGAPVKEVRFEGCRFIGLRDLPVFIIGVDSVLFQAPYLRRCKDPGYVGVGKLRFINASVEFSADNGVSASRGCREVVVMGCTISDSFYAGIHTSGFAGERGPELVVVSGNTVLNSRQYGISASNGSRNVVVTGNVVQGVRRGAETTGGPEVIADTNGVAYGSGIIVSGLLRDGADPTLLASYEYLSENVAITGNIVEGADRFGICLWRGVKVALVTGNTVINPGVLAHVNGTAVAGGHNYYNVGIGYYTPYSSTFESIVITGNLVVDNRDTKLMNYGVYPINSGVAKTGGNEVQGARNNVVGIGGPAGFREKVIVGLQTDLLTELSIRGSGNTTRSLNFLSGDTPIWGLRATSTGAVELFDHAAGRRVMAFAPNGAGWFVPQAALRTVSGVTANLYLDSTGEIRRIV